MTRRKANRLILKAAVCACCATFMPNTKSHVKCPDCQASARSGKAIPEGTPSIPIETLVRLDRGDEAAEDEAAAIQLAAVNALRKGRGQEPIAVWGEWCERASVPRGDTTNDNHSLSRQVVRKDVGIR